MRRVVCVSIPYFLAQIEKQRKSIEGPLLVADGGRVLGMCEVAATAGVLEGDLLHRARARCPEAVVVKAERSRYEEVWERMLEGLLEVIPAQESVTWGLAFGDVSGMGRLYPSEQALCRSIREKAQRTGPWKVCIGTAGSKFAAGIAAQRAWVEGNDIVVGTSDREYLSPLPVDKLPLSDETLRRMGLLGIRTIGQFARIPAPSVAEQFGPESIQAHGWARGKDDRPVIGQRRATLEVSLDFDVPETQREPLLQAVLSLSRKTVAELSGTGLAVRRIALEARMEGGDSWERSAWVGEPIGPTKLRAVFEGMLSDLHGDGAGIVGIQVAFTGIEPAVGKQMDLFAHTEEQSRLEEALHRLVKKHTPGCVVRARMVSPESILLRNRYELEEVKL